MCNESHKQPCLKCERKKELCEYLSKEFYIELRKAYRMLSPEADMKNYRIPHAKRLVLQLPLVNLKHKNGQSECNYVFANSVNIELCRSLLSFKATDSPSNMRPEQLRDLLSMSGSQDEREQLTYILSGICEHISNDKKSDKDIKTKLKSIRSKARRNLVARRQYLTKKKFKRYKNIITKYPDIGKTMETFVKDCGVGADAWRRTGVLTFDGNQKSKIKSKVTYKRIQKHLEQKYNRSFSYGTVVQLCVARNKRRLSAKRYFGVAAITTRRARKGFELKYNPDHHWSNSFYGGLDILQYTDGRDKSNINRDDCSVFRLDAMTSRQHPLPCVKGQTPLTTKTDYVNKYPSNLQTTSYNFTASETTSEVCVGVVKASPVHCKNPAQHFTDLTFLQSLDNQSISNSLEGNIESVRVDGGVDEGPGHEEVQWFWTKRHLRKPSAVQLVTSRDRGNSNLNRVELQNGMEGRARRGLFIPSTLNGTNIDENTGKIDNDRLKKNLNDAIDIYIGYVNGAPCSQTTIQLFKGPDSSEEQLVSKVFRKWRKGTKAEKKQLLNENNEILNEVIMIWDLRNRHVIDHGPHNYVFHLVCCYQPDCIHPICKQGQPAEPSLWYTGGPPVTFLPFPVPDPHRRPGACPEHERCGGHYFPPKHTIDNMLQGEQLPPSEKLKVAHNRGNSDSTSIGVDCTLPTEEVNMWFKHLDTVASNRRRGTRQAAETRVMKKGKATRTTIPTEAPGAVATEATVTIPTEAPVTIPTEAPVTIRIIPIEAPVTIPIEAPVTIPIEAPVTIPTEAPVTIPIEAPVTIPIEAHTADTSRFGRRRKKKKYSDFVL